MTKENIDIANRLLDEKRYEEAFFIYQILKEESPQNKVILNGYKKAFNLHFNLNKEMLELFLKDDEISQKEFKKWLLEF